jgi:outer membrane protein, heavy metal efflux system
LSCHSVLIAGTTIAASASRAAAGELATAEATEAALRLKLAGEVRDAAWHLLGLTGEQFRAKLHENLLMLLAEAVERRVKAGDLAHADTLAARAEWLEAVAQTTAIGQSLEAAERRWTLLTGLTALPDATERTSTDASSVHPEARLAEQQAALARERMEQARASRREPPELVFTAREDRSAFGDPAQRSIGLALRIPLGSASRSAPLLANAMAERDVAQARATREAERIASELALARSALSAAEQQARAETQRATLLRERAQLIDLSFKAGESPLPDLLRALSAANQADAARSRAETQLGLARARLQQAQGLLP